MKRHVFSTAAFSGAFIAAATFASRPLPRSATSPSVPAAKPVFTMWLASRYAVWLTVATMSTTSVVTPRLPVVPLLTSTAEEVSWIWALCSLTFSTALPR